MHLSRFKKRTPKKEAPLILRLAFFRTLFFSHLTIPSTPQKTRPSRRQTDPPPDPRRTPNARALLPVEAHTHPAERSKDAQINPFDYGIFFSKLFFFTFWPLSRTPQKVLYIFVFYLPKKTPRRAPTRACPAREQGVSAAKYTKCPSKSSGIRAAFFQLCQKWSFKDHF